MTKTGLTHEEFMLRCKLGSCAALSPCHAEPWPVF